ncbi:MAG TPA: DMT family transporter [Saprospiraceae bacterium]|nr:DMT family transporter [Saprospiraceae bacterium]
MIRHYLSRQSDIFSIFAKKLKLSQPTAHLFLFLVALIYGANYTIAKEVLDNGYISPSAFIVLRIGFAVVLFFIFERGIRTKKVEKKDWGRLILSGLFGAAANMLLFFYGLKYTTPIHAALIMTTTPILVLIMALFFRKEVVSRTKILGIALGMTGAISTIMSGKSLDLAQATTNGDLMVFLNATSYAIYLIIVKDLLRKYHPLTVLKWVFLFGLIFVLPFGAPSLPDIAWEHFPVHIWLATGYVLLFTTFFTYFLNVSALRVIPASTVSFYIYLQPILATIIAILLGKDQFYFKDLIWFLMIFVGVFLVSKK